MAADLKKSEERKIPEISLLNCSGSCSAEAIKLGPVSTLRFVLIKKLGRPDWVTDLRKHTRRAANRRS